MTHRLVDVPALAIRFDDDPAVVEKERHGDYANHVVPRTGRLARKPVMMSYWALLSAMVWLFYGALISSLYGTVDAMIAIGLAVLASSLLSIVVTRASIALGLSSTLLSRSVFGVLGGSFMALLMAVTITYYTVFESSTLAAAFFLWFGHGIAEWMWQAAICLFMLPLMLGSVQTWMARLNGLLLPFYMIGLGLILWLAVRASSGSGEWLAQAGAVPLAARQVPGWLSGFCLMTGTMVLIPTGADFARFCRPEDSRFHSLVTFGFPFYAWMLGLNGLAGAYLAYAMLPGDPTQEIGVVHAVLAAGGIFGLLLIVVTQIRINTINFYEASINFDRFVSSSFGIRLGRTPWVVMVAVATFLVMRTDVFSYIGKALAWQSSFFVGWVAIMVVRLLFPGKGGWAALDYRAFRVPMITPGLVAWVASSATGIALVECPGVPPLLASLAPILSFSAAIGLFLLLSLLWRQTQPGHALDSRLEVPDRWQAWIRCAVCTLSYSADEVDRNPLSGEAHCDECATGMRLGRTTEASDRTGSPDAGLPLAVSSHLN